MLVNQNNILSPQDLNILNMLQETNQTDITNHNVNEWIKCRQNPLYFILNYVYFKEYGGRCLYTKEFLHPKLRRVVRVIYRYHAAILMASRQLGKALSLDTIIPLANGGYTTMGEIKITDTILDGNGNPTQIVAITEVMNNRNCYQLEFDNGDTDIIADEDHLWKVSNSTLGFKNKIITTKELYTIQETIKNWKQSTKSRIEIPNRNKSIYFKNISPIDTVPVRCIQVSNSDGMFLCGKSMIPTHNSSISAAILSWALIFYPENRAIIFNFQKAAAQENLNKIKFIIKNLPNWLRMTVPNASRSEIKTYLELKNGSRVDTFYPSTTTSPDTLSRSLSVPIKFCRFLE